MRHLIAIALLTIFMNGCITAVMEEARQVIGEVMTSWKGTHKDDMMKVWGAPQRTAKLQEGEILTYTKSGIVSISSFSPKSGNRSVSSISSEDCQVDFIVDSKGIITDDNVQGQVRPCMDLIKTKPAQPDRTPPQLAPISTTAKPLRGKYLLKKVGCLGGEITAGARSYFDSMQKGIDDGSIYLLYDFDKGTFNFRWNGPADPGTTEVTISEGRYLLKNTSTKTHVSNTRTMELKDSVLYDYIYGNSTEGCGSGHTVQMLYPVP